MVVIEFKQGDIFTTAIRRKDDLIFAMGNFGMMMGLDWRIFLNKHGEKFPVLHDIKRPEDDNRFIEFAPKKFICFVPDAEEVKGLHDAKLEEELHKALSFAERNELDNVITTGIKSDTQAETRDEKFALNKERVQFTIDCLESWIATNAPTHLKKITLISRDHHYTRG